MNPERKSYGPGQADEGPKTDATRAEREDPPLDSYVKSGGVRWGALIFGVIVGGILVLAASVLTDPQALATEAGEADSGGATAQEAVPAPGTRTQSAVRQSQRRLPARSEREFQRKMHDDRAAIGACYQIGLAQDPNLDGVVTVRFHVAEDGRVSDVSVKRTTLHNRDVEECVVHLVSRWRFSTGRRAQTFDLDFPFEPG